MAHRCPGVPRPPARQGELLLLTPPVAGSLPAARLHHRPSFAHPQLRTPVAAIGEESRVLPVAHQPLGDGEGLQPHPVAGAFVVEVESLRTGGNADLHQPAGEGAPAGRGVGGDAQLPQPFRAVGPLREDRLQRVAGEAVEQVHQQQLLVLLLVLQAQLQQSPYRLAPLGWFRPQIRQQLLKPRVHSLAPGQDRTDRRAGQQTAGRARMALTDGVVVRVEEIAPARIGALPAGQVGLQQEGFEEPGGVPQVPLRRTGIGHPLQAEILGLQGGHQGFAAVPHAPQPLHRLGRGGRRWGRGASGGRGRGGQGLAHRRGGRRDGLEPEPTCFPYDPAT